WRAARTIWRRSAPVAFATVLRRRERARIGRRIALANRQRHLPLASRHGGEPGALLRRRAERVQRQRTGDGIEHRLRGGGAPAFLEQQPDVEQRCVLPAVCRREPVADPSETPDVAPEGGVVTRR